MIVANTIQGVVIFEYFYLLILLILFWGEGSTRSTLSTRSNRRAPIF